MKRLIMFTALLAGWSAFAHAQSGAASGGASGAAGGAPGVASDVDPLVRVTQLDADGQPIGARQETRCPPKGCQLASVLRIGQTTTPFQTVVTFAGQGVYVVLESPNTGVQLHQYGDPRPAPLFLPKTSGNLVRLVHIAIDQTSGGRPLQARALIAQETWLRIEIDQSASPQNGSPQSGSPQSGASQSLAPSKPAS